MNLMYDAVGSLGTPLEYFTRLREAGVNVLEYNPVNPLKARTGWRLNNRDHSKLVIVDGTVAFTGGINISDVYSSGSSPASTRGSASSEPRGKAACPALAHPAEARSTVRLVGAT